MSAHHTGSKVASRDDIPWTESKWRNIPIAIRYAWKDYLITGCITLATLLSIIFSYNLSERQLAALISATGMAGKTLDEYKKKVEELYGREAVDNINSEIAKDHFDDLGIQIATMPILELENLQCYDTDTLFFDNYTQTWFWANMLAVKDAIILTNRAFNHRGCAAYKEFAEMIGYEANADIWYDETMFVMGWGCELRDIKDSIDIEIRKSNDTVDGKEFYIVNFDLTCPETLRSEEECDIARLPWWRCTPQFEILSNAKHARSH